MTSRPRRRETIRSGVVLLLAVVISFFLDSPWNWVVLACGAVLEIGEVVWGRRLARRWRPSAGVETLPGRQAEVVSDCRPDGMVRIDGELWQARCAAGAGAGETVTIVAVDGLTLDVEPTR